MAKHLALAAARADNFYHPPDWDPGKESLDKYHNSHPLRERARKLGDGILIIRFEMPFHVWCDGCGELIGKGVRFNAEKKQDGNYLSTRIWTFTMRHHCGAAITIATDPKKRDYVIRCGAHRKESSFSAADAGVPELPDEEEKQRLASDALFRLERKAGRSALVATRRSDLAGLLEHSSQRGEGRQQAALMRAAKRDMRVKRTQAAALESRKRELGLPDGVVLTADTDEQAALAEATFHAKKRRTRRATPTHASIMQQDIFGGSCHNAQGRLAAAQQSRRAARQSR